jgi:hypothetical protein
MEGIRITYADRKHNGFVTLVGAAWATAEEAEDEWEKLRSHQARRKTVFLADRMTAEGMTDNYYLTGKTVELLLGEPLRTLIARGRQNTCFTARQLRDRLRLMSGD